MKLYNTLSRKVEEFTPIEKGEVRFYQCGPTVYWVQHIGNLRAMVWADLIRRSFLFDGYKVQFVRNYTDVGHLTSDEDQGEDKMEKGARREGKSPSEIAQKYIDIFENDTEKLNLLPIPQENRPRATEYIKPMIDMVGKLINGGHAYITEFAVYFDVSTFSHYNALNKQKLDFNKKGSGKGTVEDPQKKHAEDFAVWFFKKGEHKNALQTWPSPWGEGFPGWHLECSAMSKKRLGKTIDVHMGGVEHISVHHTNEIAQSESVNGVKFVNYWLHNEHLNVNGGKMAKSQGTGFTLKEIEDKGFDPMDLRYFFLQAHYRSKQNFTWEALQAARQGRDNLYNMYFTDFIPEKTELSTHGKKYLNTFKDIISNDFQIPQALALAWTMLKDEKLTKTEKKALFDTFDTVFGLGFASIVKETHIIPEEIRMLAEKRLDLKKQKKYNEADTIRRQIEEKGYVLEDRLINGAEQYSLRRK